ncbi:MAG TPA: hypothetical protein VEK56_07285 [Vicinamibacterales bacterium]|nr:hypothetical protein [Vicinamibacterales bacterium]
MTPTSTLPRLRASDLATKRRWLNGLKGGRLDVRLSGRLAVGANGRNASRDRSKTARFPGSHNVS